MDSKNEIYNRKRVRTKKPEELSNYLFGKVPPQARSLEDAVLGAIMLQKASVSEVIDLLKPEHFYNDNNKHIFDAVCKLFDKSEPIDILTLTEQLRKMGKLTQVGGPSHISELTNRVASAANIEYHARIVAQKFVQRELIRISTQTINEAYEDTTDVFELLQKAEQQIFSITNENIKRGGQTTTNLLAKAIDEIEAIKNKGGGITGTPSGLYDLDKQTSGWQKSDLVIIAARPGMGKCLSFGTKVVMFDGSLKEVQNLIPGELLMGVDSNPKKIKSICTGKEKMYWVRQKKGIDYRVNKSHILSLKRSRHQPPKHTKGEVLNISVSDYLNKSNKFKTNYKGYKTDVEFPAIINEIPPYLLGIWLGDGSKSGAGVTNSDQEIIDYIYFYAKSTNQKVTKSKDRCNANTYSIVKKNKGKGYCLKLELRKINVINNKHIPKSFLINSKKNRLELLAGLLDTDGHYQESSNVFEIIQKIKPLAEQIKFLADSLGFKTSINKKTGAIKSINFKGVYYKIIISGNVNIIPTKVKRKQAREYKSIKDWRVTGITLEYDKVDNYYGFEIEGDNKLFLLEDFTVTHNTSFVLSMARNAAVDNKKTIAFFSLEMSAIQLTKRLIASEAEIALNNLRNGNLKDNEWKTLTEKVGPLSDANLIIDDTPAINIFELRAKCRRLKQQQGIDMVIIDYLQLMSGMGDRKSFNREQEISNISRSLKTIAKELDIPVIALSQLSRAVETRGGNKRPMLSDLRESGAIEQDADLVLFLYRPEYYGMDELDDGTPSKGLAEVIIAKHRNGPTGSVITRFVGQYAKFVNLQESMHYNTDENIESKKTKRADRTEINDETPF